MRNENNMGMKNKVIKKSPLIIIAVFSILIGLITGFASYNHAFELIYEYAQKSLLDRARHLAQFDSGNVSEASSGQLLRKIEEHWRGYRPLSEDEYLCIVDGNSNLVLHTRSRATQGNFVGSNRILSKGSRTEKCLADLSKTRRKYVGEYISSSGEIQIAAFFPVKDNQYFIGVHRSRKVFHSEINSRIRIFLYAFLIIFCLILPFTFFTFYRTMRKVQKREINTLRKLADTENQFTAFLENSITGCYIYQDRFFKFANKKFLDLLGFSTYDNLKNEFSITDIVAQDGINSIKELMMKQLNGEIDQFQNIVLIKRGDGSEIWMEIFSNKVNFEGKPASFGIVVDISDRKKFERELTDSKDNLENSIKLRTREIEDQVEKLNKSQRAMLFMIEDLNKTSKQLKLTQDELLLKERLAVLGQFSGSISHELRNPLSVIDSSTYYLRDSLKTEDKKIIEHLKRIKTGVMTSTSIIESLLNLTRMKKPRLENYDLISIIKNSIEEVKIPKGVKLKTVFCSKKIYINCETLQIKIALKNIIKNGIESMEEEGDLTISTMVESGDRVKVVFRDTGNGICKENIGKIFLPLFTMKAKGIGFGLPITKMIVENHNGEIVVSSAPDKGTEFTLFFPITGKE